MSKILKWATKNLLGIAVAIGVCSFLYEGLIRPINDFTLTKYAGLLVLIVAVYTRFKDNKAFQAAKTSKNK